MARLPWHKCSDCLGRRSGSNPQTSGHGCCGVSMAHKSGLEALYRMLRDIRDCDKPFGSLTVLICGDFQQILLVVTKGTPADELKACAKLSYLGKSRKLRLSTLAPLLCSNLRVSSPLALLCSPPMVIAWEPCSGIGRIRCRWPSNPNIVHEGEVRLAHIACADMALLVLRSNLVPESLRVFWASW